MSAWETPGDDALVGLFMTPRIDHERAADCQRRALSAAFEAQGRGLRQMAMIGGSALDFVHRRLRHDAETAQALGTCRTPADAWLIWRDFFDTAVEDYAAGLGALGAPGAEQEHAAPQGAGNEAEAPAASQGAGREAQASVAPRSVGHGAEAVAAPQGAGPEAEAGTAQSPGREANALAAA